MKWFKICKFEYNLNTEMLYLMHILEYNQFIKEGAVIPINMVQIYYFE